VNLDQNYLTLNHRPETETPLKNGTHSERHVAISPETAQLLQDWIRDQRPDAVDEHGRKPLISCGDGRLHGQTIQAHIYDATRPCLIAECPHDRDPQECEAVGAYTKAHKCPSTIAPHDIRRSSITHFLKNDVAIGHVSDRADVSEEVIRKHYDQMTSKENMEQRRDCLGNI
jgi:integrase